MPFDSDRQRRAFFAKRGISRTEINPRIITTFKKAPTTISDAKAANKRAGKFFFSKDAMRFFNSRVETKGALIGGRFFVTSEQFDEKAPRKFTIRELKSSGDVVTVGDFQGFSSLSGAVSVAKKLS